MYSAPYIAGNAGVSFFSERQMYEARALRHVPWRLFSYHNIPLDMTVRSCCRVTLPEKYLDDPENHCTILQDCTPKTRTFGDETQPAYSFHRFCRTVGAPETKYRTARQIGLILGTFLAQMHAWARKPEHHREVSELFAGNDRATDVLVEATVTGIFRNLQSIDYELSDKQRWEVTRNIEELASKVKLERETLVVGDFW